MQTVSMDIGVFAHNEAAGIGALIADLGRQSIFRRPDIDLRILILANGCTDDTVPVARRAIQALTQDISALIEVFDLSEGGKSRTGHAYIHTLSRPDLDLIAFMDGDIRLPQAETLERMADHMQATPGLRAFSSRPIKDVVHDNVPLRGAARLIAMGGDGLTDFRKSICGQLFVLRAQTARRIGLPAGLPVEDGFIRAMVLTELLSAPEDLSCIDGDPEIYHVYESIQTAGELIQHQTRIVIGSAVNAALFRRIRQDTGSEAEAHALLMKAASEPEWLRDVLKQDLPRAPFGYVPFDFLTKRLRTGTGRRGLKAWVVLSLGLCLDAVSYVLASWRMARGQGAGHW